MCQIELDNLFLEPSIALLIIEQIPIRAKVADKVELLTRLKREVQLGLILMINHSLYIPFIKHTLFLVLLDHSLLINDLDRKHPPIAFHPSLIHTTKTSATNSLQYLEVVDTHLIVLILIVVITDLLRNETELRTITPFTIPAIHNHIVLFIVHNNILRLTLIRYQQSPASNTADTVLEETQIMVKLIVLVLTL